MSALILQKPTFFQLSILIARGGVGADNLLFKLASNPIGEHPEAVVLSSIPSSQVPQAPDLRNSADFRMNPSSDTHEAICFLANSKPRPWGRLIQLRAWKKCWKKTIIVQNASKQQILLFVANAIEQRLQINTNDTKCNHVDARRKHWIEMTHRKTNLPIMKATDNPTVPLINRSSMI